MEPPVSEPSAAKAVREAHQRRRAAAGAAGHPVGVPGVARDAEAGIFRGRAHGELVHVGASERDGPGGAQARDDRGVVGRTEVAEDFGAAVARLVLDADGVLDRDGHTAQGQVHVRLVGEPASLFEFVGQVAADAGVHGSDAVREGVEGLARGEFLRAQAALKARGGFKNDVLAHAGTRKGVREEESSAKDGAALVRFVGAGIPSGREQRSTLRFITTLCLARQDIRRLLRSHRLLCAEQSHTLSHRRL